ncbi:3',5'-cyclic-nucleotide phosphodiesterase [Minicystis rosea]|nr:3',5'-cyclic-nucleotide phosphodiesterase [Minicystis rosea]
MSPTCRALQGPASGRIRRGVVRRAPPRILRALAALSLECRMPQSSSQAMTHLAHLSDLHLLEANHGSRSGAERRRLAFLSAGRQHDAEARKRRAVRALQTARRSGADHVVITGDLTEDGIPAQYEVLAEVLHESGLAASQVTIVPGNHDAYAHGDAFADALRGPLSAYAETSTPGVPVMLRDMVLLPVSTAMAQPYTFSAGAIAEPTLASARQLAADSKKSGRALVLAMHHPPQRRAIPLMQWLDGLRDHAQVAAILEEHDHVHVVHGHLHEIMNRSVRPGATPRIFGTEAVVTGRTPVRFYHARHARLLPATELVWTGAALVPA